MMKKIKNYLLFFPVLSSSFLLISCAEVSNFYIPENKVYKKENSSITQLLNNIYIERDKQKDAYIFQKNNLNTTQLLEELKYSFSFYNPSLFKIDTTQSQDLKSYAKHTIYNNFTNNWLFILNNIKEFEFAFNPYSFSYSPYTEEKEDFENQPQTFLQIESEKFLFIKKQIVSENSYWDSQNIYYLIFDKNKILRLWTFEKDQKIYARLDFDLLVYKDNPNFIVSFIDEIHNKILNYSLESKSEEIKRINANFQASEAQEIEALRENNNKLEKKEQKSEEEIEKQIKEIQASYKEKIQQAVDQINDKYLNIQSINEESKYNIFKNNYYISLNSSLNFLKNKWDFQKYSFRNIYSEILQTNRNLKSLPTKSNSFLDAKDKSFLKYENHNFQIQKRNLASKMKFFSRTILVNRRGYND